MTHYTQLSMQDRCKFNILLQNGIKMSEIAIRLGRHRSTLYRELNRNKQPERYSPGEANKKSLSRRTRRCNIERFPALRAYVMTGLKQGWSPEQIAGRLKRKNSKYVICHETIYRFIYKNTNNNLYKYLRYKKPNRRRLRTRQRQECRFGKKRLLTERPVSVEGRKYVGHWEGDCIEFGKARNFPVTTLVERKTRLVVLVKNESKLSNTVMGNIKQKLQQYPLQSCKTITFDQGSEFAYFNVLEKSLQCRVYYCHKHAPWEKGGNENMNGRLRRYLPKSLDIREINQEALDSLADKMNTTPRKCLGYQTPRELFLQHYKIDCRT